VLHWACLLPTTKANLVTLLLDAGANVDLKTSKGKTAYDVAMDKHPDWPRDVLARLRPSDYDALAAAKAGSRISLPMPPSTSTPLSRVMAATAVLGESS